MAPVFLLVWIAVHINDVVGRTLGVPPALLPGLDGLACGGVLKRAVFVFALRVAPVELGIGEVEPLL